MDKDVLTRIQSIRLWKEPEPKETKREMDRMFFTIVVYDAAIKDVLTGPQAAKLHNRMVEYHNYFLNGKALPEK